MQTAAYLRVSTNAQDLNAQKLAVLEFARKENMLVDDFIETTLSSRRDRQREELQALKGSLGRSKLEGREHEIELLLSKGVSKASIAKITDVSRSNLLHFIRTCQLELHA